MTQVDNTRKYAIEELPIDTSGWELKKLRQFVGHDTNMGFAAELHIDGKKVADLEDDSMGGGMHILASKDHREMLDKITETLKQYPKMFWSERGWDTPDSGCDYLKGSTRNENTQRKTRRRSLTHRKTSCGFTIKKRRTIS